MLLAVEIQGGGVILAAGVVNPMLMWVCAKAILGFTRLGCRRCASAVAATGETLLPLTCTFAAAPRG